ncbi:hypothetical protein [Streptomyces melanogenes]|uniref:hypothetical protein n=1 Tax=Streptomyces melanogenes TaxID=67326 RepID=UPI0037A01D17
MERPHRFRLPTEPPGDTEGLGGIADLVDEQNAKLLAAVDDGIGLTWRRPAPSTLTPQRRVAPRSCGGTVR